MQNSDHSKSVPDRQRSESFKNPVARSRSPMCLRGALSKKLEQKILSDKLLDNFKNRPFVFLGR